MRRAATVFSLVLLAATAAAFVTTERQKLEPSPVGAIEIDRVFSPTCGCPQRSATIRIGLRRAETVTLELVSEAGERVRSLVRRRRFGRGDVELAWDGRDDAGRIVADGSYRPRLTLASGARSFVLPNPIRLDTEPPRVTRADVEPDVFSPDGDGRNDRIEVRYAVSEPAHGLLFVDAERRVRTRAQPVEGRMEWFGRVQGRSLPAGAYRVTVAAEDTAGNVGRRTDDLVVKIRYIALARPVIRARARTRFGVRVATDARSFRWR
ncbi:MAG: FlgD immunoglobulin-like domain containing protein, partial [Gaiellaceae bacterium]